MKLHASSKLRPAVRSNALAAHERSTVGFRACLIHGCMKSIHNTTLKMEVAKGTVGHMCLAMSGRIVVKRKKENLLLEGVVRGKSVRRFTVYRILRPMRGQHTHCSILVLMKNVRSGDEKESFVTNMLRQHSD